MTESILHNLDEQVVQKPSFNPLILFVVVAIIAGIFSGKIISGSGPIKTVVTKSGMQVQQTGSKTTYGQMDSKTYPDCAEGKMEKGGVDGEGTHHLTRKGGVSQNVYLTSASIDLSQFVSKTVKVCGKTYAAQTAGWLMDAGYLEVK